MALRTSRKNFILKNGRDREFVIRQNANLTTSLIESDDPYDQIGDYDNGLELNEMSAKANYFFVQTITGNIVSFETQDEILPNSTISGIVLIETAIPSGATFKVNDVEVPAYMGEDMVTTLPVGKWASFVFDGTQLNFKGGGGGLNFKVITVASADELPATAKENTIAIISETASLELLMRSGSDIPTKRADGTPLNVGDVWISLGTASNATMLFGKKKELAAYPISAYQWNGTQWLWCFGYVFIGTEWKQLGFYLYQYGALVPFDFWTSNFWSTAGDSDGTLYVSPDGNSSGTAMAVTRDGINLNGYRTLRFVLDGSIPTQSRYAHFGLFSAKQTSSIGANGVELVSFMGDGAVPIPAIVDVDVSAYNGTYYVGFAMYGTGGGVQTMMVSQIIFID